MRWLRRVPGSAAEGGESRAGDAQPPGRESPTNVERGRAPCRWRERHQPNTSADMPARTGPERGPRGCARTRARGVSRIRGSPPTPSRPSPGARQVPDHQGLGANLDREVYPNPQPGFQHEAAVQQVARPMRLFLIRLRARADRRVSWASLRSRVPAVEGPGLADEPTERDDCVGERDVGVDHFLAPLGAPGDLVELVAPGVRALNRPPLGVLDRRSDAFDRYFGTQPVLGRCLSSLVGPVGGIEVHGGLLGKRSEPVEFGQGGAEQRGVVAVTGRGHRSKRDAVAVGGGRALQVRRSTGLGPAHSPPHTALVWQPSTGMSLSTSPTIRT